MQNAIKAMTTCSNPLRVASFFAGIGGFDLAFEKHGFQSVFQVENDPFCRSILQRHWPLVRNCEDIRDVDPNEIPEAEVWVAGFPCQDLSIARTPHGIRSGLNGTRSGLFFSFLDLIEARLPQVVLLENVAGLLSSHRGADFSTLVTALSRLGYAVAWRVLNARYFGTPQSRPRVFICAWRGSPEKATKSLYEDKIADQPVRERAGFISESICHLTGISVPQVSFCISATSGRHTGLDWARSYVSYPDRVRRLTPTECERLQGFDDGWSIPSEIPRASTRGLETNRYHAIGNAVCVPVVEWIAERIAAIAINEPLPETIETMPVDVTTDLAKRFLGPNNIILRTDDTPQKTKWRSGGLITSNFFTTQPASTSPAKPVISSLIDIVEKHPVDERYFLSINAAEGILRRVDRLGRTLFPPLDATLRSMVKRRPQIESNVVRQTELVI